MQKSNLLIATIFTAFLSACSNTNTLEQQIQANIDPEIQGEERWVIAEHMRFLSPQDWKAVTYIANGKIYVNRVALKGLLEVAQPVSGNLYRLSDGTIFPVPDDTNEEPTGYQVVTICTSTTGPFRRVKTQPGTATSNLTRFGYARATISPGGLLLGDDLPPSVLTSAGEVAYAYLGTSVNGSLAESDAGLQWSPATNSWSVYVKSGGTLVTTTPPPPGAVVPTPFPRYAWYGETTLTFSVISDGRARIAYSGTTVGSAPNPYSIDFGLPGIRADGVNNVFKRVTSIAQTTPSNTSGSRYTVAWSHLALGRTASSGLHIWGQAGRDIGENCKTNKVEVASTGSSSEEVFINLN